MEILEFKDSKTIPDIIHPYTSTIRNNATPIIIDNGNKNPNYSVFLIFYLQVRISVEPAGLLALHPY